MCLKPRSRANFLEDLAVKMRTVVSSYYLGDALLAEQLPHYFDYCAAVALPTRYIPNKGVLRVIICNYEIFGAI